jgi:hypothetical protein
MKRETDRKRKKWHEKFPLGEYVVAKEAHLPYLQIYYLRS